MPMRVVSILTVVLAVLAGPAQAELPTHPATTPDINAADLSARDKAIADDVFQGRGPGSARCAIGAGRGNRF